MMTINDAGELQGEVRAAFSQSEFGRGVADRLGRRLLLVRALDDLVDLAANLNLLLTKPQDKETWAGHGRDRWARRGGGGLCHTMEDTTHY